MFSSLETGAGLDVVVWLQAHGNPMFDALATVFHYLGLPVFYLPMLALVYWSLDKHLGRRMLFALVVSLALVNALKFLFKASRPYQVSDLVVALVNQPGYGIPSGHVSDGLLVWGYLARTLKRRWLWGLLGVYVAIMAWARLYAGVHYPQDVIAGFIVGATGLWLFTRIADPLEAAWQTTLNAQTQVAIVLLSVVAMVALLYGSDDGMAAAGVLLGSGLGYIVETRTIKFSVAGSSRQRILRYLIGVTLTLTLFFGLDALFAGQEPVDILRIIRYVLVTVFAVAGWPWLMGRMGLSRDLVESRTAESEQRAD